MPIKLPQYDPYLHALSQRIRDWDLSPSFNTEYQLVSRMLHLMLFAQQPYPIFRIITGRHAMAKTFGDVMFSSLALLAEDEKKFTAWVSKENPIAMDILRSFTEQGFKVSLVYVIEQNSFCFSVIGTEDTKLHKKMILTSWSDQIEEAILIAAYKHFIMCDSGAWPVGRTGTRWG